MTDDIKVFPTPADIAQALTAPFCMAATKAQRAGRSISIALAGGRTPRRIYEEWATVRTSIPWKNVQLFWGDERCVDPDHEDSNFRLVRETLLAYLKFPEKNLHRIQGEADPAAEAKRYSEEIENALAGQEGVPRFDWVLLGLGEDGHTASLFPGEPKVLAAEKWCSAVVHPKTSQKRITLNLDLINQARRVSFVVTGKEKARVVAEILGKEPQSQGYPASQVQPVDGVLEWCLDKAAAQNLP